MTVQTTLLTGRHCCECTFIGIATYFFSFFHLSVAKQPNSGLGCFIVEVYSSHTTSRTPMNKWWACHIGHYLHNKHNRPSYDLGRIQTPQSSNQAATDLQLRLHGHVLLKYVSPAHWIYKVVQIWPGLICV